jgi:hypothetical protein
MTDVKPATAADSATPAAPAAAPKKAPAARKAAAPKAAPKAAPAKRAAAKPAATKASAPVKASPAKKAPVAKKAPAAKKATPVVEKATKAKVKLVRDGFTMPANDFALIDTLKERALGFRRPTKKSELLRAGLQVLAGLSATQLQAALARLEPLKTGRPKKDA